MGSSNENMQAAFAGESQANRKYLFFAEQADKEGQPQVARLFRAAAEAETVHARNHLRAMGGIKVTKDNLVSAVNGELHEYKTMYPDFISVAEAEGNQKAKWTFDMANKVEKIHHGLYEAALKSVSAGQVLTGKTYHVCQVCGMTVEGEAPEKCPVCNAPRSQFKKVE
jgi:rubrerythrin